MSLQLMLNSTLFLLLLLIITKTAVAASIAKNNCKDRCGSVSIPYPFGIEDGCYLNPWFKISCIESSSSGPPTVLLSGIQMEVLNISSQVMSFGSYGYGGLYILVKSPIISQNCSGSVGNNVSQVNLTGSPFYYSDWNRFVAAGCNNRALMAGTKTRIVGCESDCGGPDHRISVLNRTCDGETCCNATAIPSGLQIFNATFEKKHSEVESGGCKLAFLVEEGQFSDNKTETDMEQFRALLTWNIAKESLELTEREMKEYDCVSYGSNQIRCTCPDGYEGNPYLPKGCQDIDECKDPRYNRCGKASTCVNKPGSFECEKTKFWTILGLSVGFGVLLLFIGGWQLYKLFLKRRKMQLKKKYFKRNGGLLLQQQMFSREGGIQKAKIFSSKELEKATDHFNKNRILGQGGQGTVYKGMLVDGRIVAVKKSLFLDADKVDDFINEVVILSQIDHRNVVKLLGCCLETQVPLLVYEFISNGTLFRYLHDKNEEFQLSWEMRLRIAIEAAEAISYLHSSASLPVYHRDIKSSNILLDEKYRAKVSDFGTSRSLAIDQTHLTTNVQGTFGYLDPEYFQSSQFTEKSDVYSFGVVLVELITGEKPVSIVKAEEAEEGRSLATYFILLMQENRLFDIVDTRIMQDSVHKEIMEAAKIAYRCLNMIGKNRPTMKEVVVELERIPSLQKASNVEHTMEEVETVITDMSYRWDAANSTTIGSTFDTKDASSILEMEPFIYSQNK